MYSRAIAVFLLIVSFGMTAPAVYAATDEDGNGRTYVETAQDVEADKAFDATQKQAEEPATLAQNGPIQVTPAPIQGADVASKSDGTWKSDDGTSSGTIMLSPELKAGFSKARQSVHKAIAKRKATKPLATSGNDAVLDRLTKIEAQLAGFEKAQTATTDALNALKADIGLLPKTAQSDGTLVLTPEQLQAIQDSVNAAFAATLADTWWYAKWAWINTIALLVLVVIGILVTLLVRSRRREDAATETRTDDSTNQQVLEEIRAMSGRLLRVESAVNSSERNIRGDVANVSTKVDNLDAKVEDLGQAMLQLAQEASGLGSKFEEIARRVRDEK